MIIYKLLLYLYPPAWRARYEEEMLEVLGTRPLSLEEGFDILRGSLDAHLHPHLGTTALPLTERMQFILSPLRSSLLTIFCAYIGFILAGMGFQKMTESSAFQELAQQNNRMGLSFQLIVIGAVVALLLVLIGGLPIVGAVITSAVKRRRWGSFALLAVPGLAFIMLLAVISLLKRIAHPDIQSFWQIFLGRGLFFGTLITAAIVSTGAVCFAIARSEIPTRFLRFALLPSMLTTATMALIEISTIIWGLSLRESAPQLFAGNEGIVRTSTMGTWLSIVIAMALATGLATLFLIRGLSAYSTLKKITT